MQDNPKYSQLNKIKNDVIYLNLGTLHRHPIKLVLSNYQDKWIM